MPQTKCVRLMNNLSKNNLQPLVSVIVPVYKVEKEIHRCIDSLLKQTYSNLQIILIDDGSPDNCGTICDLYAGQDSKICVIHQENQGVSAARNAGLAVAQGEYIGFADPDDWVEPNWIEILIRPFFTEPVMVSACGWYRHDECGIRKYLSKVPEGKQHGKKILADIIQGDSVDGYLCNKLYKKELFLNRSLRKGIRACEDLLCCCQIFHEENICVWVTPKPLYHYIVRDGSAIRRYSPHRKDELIVRKEILDMVQQDKLLRGIALFTYAQANLSLAEVALQAGEKKDAGEFRKEAGKFFAPAIFACGIGVKKKLKLLLQFLLVQQCFHSQAAQDSR